MGHSRRVGPIRSAYDAERITMRGTGASTTPTRLERPASLELF